MNLNNLISVMPEPSSSSKNVLTNDVKINGSLHFETELIFDGNLEGEITTQGILTVGKNAHMKGEIKAKSVIIHGCVDGNVTVTEKCELKSSSQLNGDLKAMRMLIEEGATFIGKSEVSPNKSGKSAEHPKNVPAPTLSSQESVRKSPMPTAVGA